MGLDMYLYRRRYVKNWDHYKPEEQTEVILKIGGKRTDLIRPAFILEEVGYWRKANAIHKFFCGLDGGKDDCQNIRVSAEALEELRRRCTQILTDHSKASELLPTQDGFFFGSTEYDQYYFSDLEDTVKILDPLLEDPTEDFEYRASW